MEDMYSRTRLLLGDGTDDLKSSRVAVFGCGGVGSYIIEALARAGVGEIAVIDGDCVAESNINRQLVADRTTVGQRKAEVARERILRINPDCRAVAYDMFYTAENADAIDLSHFDYVADAIDTVTSKLEIISRCRAAGVNIISSMGTGNKLDPTQFQVADIYKTSMCPLAKVMRRELKKRGVKKLKVVYSTEKPTRPLDDMSVSCRTNCICPPGAAHKCTERRDIPGSVAFVPSVVGLIIAGEVVKDLTIQRKAE